MKHALILFSLCLAAVVHAERWTIDETISVEPGPDVDVTFQVFPDYDPDQSLIHGWKGDDLEYLIISDRQPGGKKHNGYWKGMIKELKSGADNRKVNVLAEGTYSTAGNNEISYKLLSFASDGEVTTQMMNLVVGKKNAYWLIAAPFSEDLDYMVNQTKAVLKTLTITE